MAEEHADVVDLVQPPVWQKSVLQQLDDLWCVEIDLIRTPEGRNAVKVSAYGHDEKPIDYPLLRSLFPAGPPSMIPTDCPLPLWLAYSAVAQCVEFFVNDSSEFTLG